MNQRGIIALLIGIVAMFLASTLALSAVFVFLNRAKAAKNIVFSYEAIYASEAGVEDILLRYFDGTKSLPSSYPSIFSVGNTSASTTLSTDPLGNATIIAEGDRLDRIRKLRIYASPEGPGVFHYAVQIGEGGLQMDASATVVGTVYSNGNITGDTGSTIEGDALAVTTISSPNPTVTGTKTEGADQQDLPVIDTSFWKAQANINNDPITGDHEIKGKNNTLGPRKIEGTLTIKSGAELTVTGPIHATGNIEIRSNSKIFIDESFVASSTVVIVGGTIEFNSKSQVNSTTATPKGYLMFFSESTSTDAITLDSNQLIDAAVYAPDGTVVIESNARVTSIAGKAIHLKSNARIEYDFGLQDADFTGGPSSGASITSWQEQ